MNFRFHGMSNVRCDVLSWISHLTSHVSNRQSHEMRNRPLYKTCNWGIYIYISIDFAIVVLRRFVKLFQSVFCTQNTCSTSRLFSKHFLPTKLIRFFCNFPLKWVIYFYFWVIFFTKSMLNLNQNWENPMRHVLNFRGKNK